MTLPAHRCHDRDRLRQRLARFVGTVARRQRFEDIRNREHPRGHTELAAVQPLRVARPVHPFMMAAGDFRHVLQVPGERQL